MEFLVQIDVSLPPEMDEIQRAELIAAERAYGLELCHSGVIHRIWRIPGGVRNVGIWHASDATELRAAIAGLPMYPWVKAEVTALAAHPLESDP